MLSAAVQKATENFIISGEQIAHDFPEVEQDMLSAIDEVRKTGLCICLPGCLLSAETFISYTTVSQASLQAFKIDAVYCETQ